MVAVDFYQVPIIALIYNVFLGIKTVVDPHQSL
jgi:hypothetical protein